MDRSAAILDAGCERFRPIVMTALTTIVGLIPMAAGDANVVGTPYYPLGQTVIGGLISSTLLSLLVVPLLYSLFDDLRDLVVDSARGYRDKPPWLRRLTWRQAEGNRFEADPSLEGGTS